MTGVARVASSMASLARLIWSAMAAGASSVRLAWVQVWLMIRWPAAATSRAIAG